MSTNGANIMNLGELIGSLEQQNPALKVRFDFVHFCPNGTLFSYRGDYSQLALDYDINFETTVEQLIKVLKEIQDTTLYGYKGGEYIMDFNVKVYVAHHNESGGTYIYDVRDDDWVITLITRIQS